MPATKQTTTTPATVCAINGLNKIDERLSAIDQDLRFLRSLFHKIRNQRDGLDDIRWATSILVHDHNGLVTRMERRLRGLEAYALGLLNAIRDASAAGELPELNDLGFDIFHALDEAEFNVPLAGNGSAVLVEPLPDHGNAVLKAVESGVDVIGHGSAPGSEGLDKSAGGGDDPAGRRFSSEGDQA